MWFFETLAGITWREWAVFLSMTVAITTIAARLAYGWGRFKGWHDRRQNVDRDNITIATPILHDNGDGTIAFSIETHQGRPDLHQVFGDRRIENEVRRAVTGRESGLPLFGPNSPDHYVAMERTCLFLSGPDPVATQSAAFRRPGDYEEDRAAVYLTALAGEDGVRTPHIIKVDPYWLERVVADDDFRAKLRPTRQVYGHYIDALVRMAYEHVESQNYFRTISDEKRAGALATVWTVIVRTQKTLTAADVRAIVAELLSGRKAA